MARHVTQRPPGEALLEPEPTAHCAMCERAAPMTEQFAYSRDGFALTPCLIGWFRAVFPWSPKSFMAASPPEWLNLCPACAEEVAKFIAHRRKPMLSDEDLIG